MKEGICSRDLALSLPVSEKLEFVLRPLENAESLLIEGSLRNPGPPISPTGARLAAVRLVVRVCLPAELRLRSAETERSEQGGAPHGASRGGRRNKSG